ncbi:MAG TPA: thiolase family protein [Bacillota bacterium]|nr:thiolase family protein [Bacillota bacterium]
MREALILSGVRTAIGKAPRGSLSRERPDELAAAVIAEAVRRVPGLEPARIEDVILGCALPEGPQGLNVARIAALRAGLPASVPGYTVNRFCASGLQAVWSAAAAIATGTADIVVAGGVESMSLVPVPGGRPEPNPYLVEHYPAAYMSMGQTAEEVAARYEVSRADQDAFALESHRRAAAAIAAGRFTAEILPVPVRRVRIADGMVAGEDLAQFAVDEGVRRDTSAEALAGLRPAFREGGTVTAGNASQTSDGAAALVLASPEAAAALGCRPLGVFRSFAVAGVDPDVMGIGPVEAVPKALARAGAALSSVDLVELNEAFASQSLAVIRRLGLDPARVNPNGGAIALGHPLGCTGARLTVTLLNELARQGGRRGVVTMCIGGGMGAAAVIEAA